MSPYLGYIFNFTILIGAIIGLLRFRRINPVFYPFLCIMWAGSINEVTSITLIFLGYYNIINFNFYNLVESLLVVWLFYKWRLFNENSKLYYALLLTFSLTWLLDMIFISGFSHFNSFYRIFYSFVLVLLSINMINRLLFQERISLLRNPVFLICAGFIIFYTVTVSTEAFFVYGLKLSDAFQSNINHTLTAANLVCNLIYALAILWMPRRQAFSLQY